MSSGSRVRRGHPAGCGSAAAILAAVLAPSIARADWAYTRWGMSPAAVTAASGGKAVPRPEPFVRGASHVLLQAPYRRRGIDYLADFDFADGERLRAVYLNARRPRACGRVRAMLVAEHRRDRVAPGALLFHAKRTNDMISLNRYPGTCAVIYQRLDEAE